MVLRSDILIKLNKFVRNSFAETLAGLPFSIRASVNFFIHPRAYVKTSSMTSGGATLIICLLRSPSKSPLPHSREKSLLPFTPLLLSRQVSQAVVNPRPAASDAPSAKLAINGLPRRVLAGQVSPLATSAVDVKDGVNSQAHISLTLPSAGFRSGDQAFD